MIKIQSYQEYGKLKTDKDGNPELVDEYEFCCWEAVLKWLNKFDAMNKCEKCKCEENGPARMPETWPGGAKGRGGAFRSR